MLCLVLLVECSAFRRSVRLAYYPMSESGQNSTNSTECGVTEAHSLWGMVIVVAIVLLCAIIAFVVERFSFHFIPESCVFMIIGMIVGSLVRFSAEAKSITSFDGEAFFVFLLPPIILDNGYSMQKVRVLCFSFSQSAETFLSTYRGNYYFRFPGNHHLWYHHWRCAVLSWDQ